MRNSALHSVIAALTLAILSACGGATAVKPAIEPVAKQPEPPPEAYQLNIETTKGRIVVEVQRKWAPRGADRFWELVASGYYDESRFYRVIRGAIAQFGINKDPKVSARWRGLAIPDDPPGLKNLKGTLAFAKMGPNSRTTQVFINLRNNSELDRQGFVPFAKIVEGMDVAEKLYAKYGETSNRGGGGPDGAKAEQLGNAYLESGFTQLDYIKSIARSAP